MTSKSLIVVSQIKSMTKVDEKSLAVSSDFYEALNNKVRMIIEKACKRAKANNRNTVMGRDV